MPKRNERIEIAGRSYRVVKNVGNGGSGSVWLVDCEGEGYALKLIVSDNSGKIARFQKEIDFCSAARHRNIVRVLASGWYNSQPVYLMRCYAHTFREVIEKEKDAAKLIGYILEICRGIKYIHAKGVIHRDIKPENILIEGKVAVLADFGIAHFKGLGITRLDELLANRNYMAPEQKIKNNARNIDKSADVYALGVMINECFTKQNLGGSWYRLIADSYPMLAALDNLVSSLIRQHPQERPAIAAVETELKFIYGKYKRGFLEMRENLLEQVYPRSLSRSLVNTIIRRASEDILMGKHLFLTSSADEFRQYNGHWHMKVGYCVDDFLLNLYIQEQIFGYCKSKFNYESNVYRK
ncbi:MAG: serine/threonine protein kinase, partial [Pedobacter sp.]